MRNFRDFFVCLYWCFQPRSYGTYCSNAQQLSFGSATLLLSMQPYQLFDFIVCLKALFCFTGSNEMTLKSDIWSVLYLEVFHHLALRSWHLFSSYRFLKVNHFSICTEMWECSIMCCRVWICWQFSEGTDQLLQTHLIFRDSLDQSKW